MHFLSVDYSFVSSIAYNNIENMKGEYTMGK